MVMIPGLQMTPVGKWCQDWKWFAQMISPKCINCLVSMKSLRMYIFFKELTCYFEPTIEHRARRISENLFGILANRWRFMRNVLLLHPDVIEILVSAALVLHNFLRESDPYCPIGLLDTESVTAKVVTGLWRQDPSFSAMEPFKARLHRRFWSRQLDAVFVARKLQLENRTCKPGANFQCDLSAVISQGFRTCLKIDATSARQKLHRLAATKIACVNGPLEIPTRGHNSSVEAKHVRDVFKYYFVPYGTVEWQWERC